MDTDAVSEQDDRGWDEIVEQLRAKNGDGTLSEWLAENAVVSAAPAYSDQNSAVSIDRQFSLLETGNCVSIDWVINECPYYDHKPQDVPPRLRRDIAVDLLTHAVHE